MTYRYPSLADVAAFVDTHGDETWLRAPAWELACESCSHGSATVVPYSESYASLPDDEPCEPCIKSHMFDRVWQLYEESLVDWDSTNNYLEMTS